MKKYLKFVILILTGIAAVAIAFITVLKIDLSWFTNFSNIEYGMWASIAVFFTGIPIHTVVHGGVKISFPKQVMYIFMISLLLSITGLLMKYGSMDNLFFFISIGTIIGAILGIFLPEEVHIKRDVNL